MYIGRWNGKTICEGEGGEGGERGREKKRVKEIPLMNCQRHDLSHLAHHLRRKCTHGLQAPTQADKTKGAHLCVQKNNIVCDKMEA